MKYSQYSFCSACTVAAVIASSITSSVIAVRLTRHEHEVTDADNPSVMFVFIFFRFEVRDRNPHVLNYKILKKP
jgi:hypothetical protein